MLISDFVYLTAVLLLPGGDIVSQDGAQFEDALRRLNALESKLAGQVSPLEIPSSPPVFIWNYYFIFWVRSSE